MDLNQPSTEVPTKKTNLSQVVAKDLSKKLSEYRDFKKGLRILSAMMGVHERTLKRLLVGQNRPGYLTLYKIYRVLLNTNDDNYLLANVHQLVRKEIEKKNPKHLNKGIIYHTDIQQELINDRVFGEIYVLAGTGPITKEFINFRFGTYGLDTAKKMLQLKVLETTEAGALTLGQKQANFTPELIKRIGVNLCERYSKPESTDERGKNYISIFAEGITQEIYNQWLLIDEEAYYKKIELTKKPGAKGEVRAFTFMTSDTLVEKK